MNTLVMVSQIPLVVSPVKLDENIFFAIALEVFKGDQLPHDKIEDSE
jgi:hypothetical protein